MLLFLYALLFGGPWIPFFWAAGFSLVLVVAVRLLAFRVLDDKRYLDVAAMLAELMGGAFGWTWMALAVTSFVLLIKALFIGGAWSNFFVCLLASGVCKYLTRHQMTIKQASTFKRDLVEKGMTKEEARQAWIAKADEMLHQRKRGG